MKKMVTGGWLLLCFGVVSGLWAQGGRVPMRRGPGCPEIVPPADSNSSLVATAADYVELRRTACPEGCAAYTVRVGGDGSVLWNGDSGVVVKGGATASVDTIRARELMERLSGQGLWAFCSQYVQGPQNGATTFLTLSMAGQVKKVQDTGGAAPPLLREMADDIDRVADTHQWRHGEPAQETFGDVRLIVDLASSKAGVTRLMRVAGHANMTELSDMAADSSLDLNAVDSSGWTALMYAAQAGPPEAVSILLKARANPLLRSLEGETALFAAVSSTQHADAKVRMLVAAGLDVNGQDNRGITPLMIATRHFQAPNLIASLMELGADPTKRDADGKTSFDYMMVQAQAIPVAQREAFVKGLLTRK